MTAFEERPHSPYYGAADATPLFLILLEEYVRWTGDTELARDLEREARAAITWIDEYGDRDRDGYIEYERRNPETGLENQCWKDSWDSIAFADGTLAPTPRATCELQGYVYDAKRRTARLAREVWGDPRWADKLEREAAELKTRFNNDFWIAERGFFALALDGKKRQVDSLTSNIGHLLWSGIADDDKAESCVRHLMSDELFSGWGVRTMAAGEGSYNPIGYHVGTVWPHDNSIIAWGLRRYGYRAEAARICRGDAGGGRAVQRRLPEAFGGYPRSETHYPVEYPTACSPQAWATGAPLLLLRDAARPRLGRPAPDRRSRASPSRWAASSCSTSPAAGGAWTPSGAGAKFTGSLALRYSRIPARRAGAAKLVHTGAHVGQQVVERVDVYEADARELDVHDHQHGDRQQGGEGQR